MSFVFRSAAAALATAAILASAAPSFALNLSDDASVAATYSPSVEFNYAECDGVAAAHSPDGEAVTLTFSHMEADAHDDASCIIHLTVSGRYADMQMRGGVNSHGDWSMLALNSNRRSYYSSTDETLTSRSYVGGTRDITVRVAADARGDATAWVDSLDIVARS